MKQKKKPQSGAQKPHAAPEPQVADLRVGSVPHKILVQYIERFFIELKTLKNDFLDF